jgi:hypothetical protein
MHCTPTMRLYNLAKGEWAPFFLCYAHWDGMNAKSNTSIYTLMVLYYSRWWFLLVFHCVGWDRTEGLFVFL